MAAPSSRGCRTSSADLFSSAVKQSGKTRLLEVFELLVNKPWLTGRVTAACLIRKVDQVRPTLLLDESDAAFNGEKEYAEALRGILNTGFYVGGVASACIGQGANISYKDFKTYSAKAIAGIGTLPDTVADRSIPIRLQRKSDFAAATPLQAASLVTETDFSTRYTKANVADRKSASNPHEHCIVAGVAVQESPRARVDTKEAGIKSCSACGSFALYRLPEGGVECQTCGEKSA